MRRHHHHLCVVYTDTTEPESVLDRLSQNQWHCKQFLKIVFFSHSHSPVHGFQYWSDKTKRSRAYISAFEASNLLSSSVLLKRFI